MSRTATAKWQRFRADYLDDVRAGDLPDSCGLCGGYVNVDLKRPDIGAPQLDHIVGFAVAPYREYEPANVRLVHAGCHYQRKDDGSQIERERRDRDNALLLQDAVALILRGA